jgi:hypothetical protein
LHALLSFTPGHRFIEIWRTDFESFLEYFLCSLTFSYYVLSVLCERSAQASEASVAREAIQTRAHSERFSSSLCFSFSVCPFVLLLVFSIVHDHAYVVLVIWFHALVKFHLITRFPFLCQSGLCWELSVFFSLSWCSWVASWRSWAASCRQVGARWRQDGRK